MTERSVAKPKDEITTRVLRFESLALDIGAVRSQADVLAVLAATGDIEGLRQHSLTNMLLKMEEQLGAISTRLYDEAAVSRTQEEGSHG
jgi:hypothetical protein